MAARVRVAAVGVRPPQRAGDQVAHHALREVESALAWRPDRILFPESCDRPLDAPADEPAPVLAEELRRIAAEHRCVVAYGRGRVLTVLDRDARETTAPFVESSLGKLACVVSDDLQNESLLARCRDERPDLILVASRFPGGMLEQYWAFSCRCHLASAVLFRSDLRLPCRIVSPVGAILAASTTAQTHARAAISMDCAVVHLDDHREKLLALQRSLGEGITISDPGHLGCVLVTNEGSKPPCRSCSIGSGSGPSTSTSMGTLSRAGKLSPDSGRPEETSWRATS